MKLFRFKLTGFCGRSRKVTVEAESREEAGERLSDIPMSIGPISKSKLLSVKNV